jgi:hypothetical protein
MDALWSNGISSCALKSSRLFRSPGLLHNRTDTVYGWSERCGTLRQRISNANIFEAVISRDDAQGR